MNKIETKILNCSAVREAEKNMVFAARLTQRGHMIHSMPKKIEKASEEYFSRHSLAACMKRGEKTDG